jgi:hypothetical protein
MDSKETTNGLSARRRAIDRMKGTFSRNPFIKYLFAIGLVVLISVLFISYQRRSDKATSPEGKNDKTAVVRDSLDKPKVNIQVNRHYDDKGNMIGFDSTYSSFYSNVKGDTVKMDSLMHTFDTHFNKNRFSFLDSELNSLFFTDSLRHNDFFHDDFFLKRYELNDSYFRGMMKRMDSLKNHFYREQMSKKAEKSKSDIEKGREG